MKSFIYVKKLFQTILKMERDERSKLYLRAIRNWGEEAQTNMVNEECGELITAIAQFKRGRTSHHDVMTELADVAIMVEQLATIMSYSDFEQEKDRKLERLRERLDKFEAKKREEDGNNS